jgi:hypothetical protein
MIQILIEHVRPDQRFNELADPSWPDDPAEALVNLGIDRNGQLFLHIDTLYVHYTYYSRRPDNRHRAASSSRAARAGRWLGPQFDRHEHMGGSQTYSACYKDDHVTMGHAD